MNSFVIVQDSREQAPWIFPEGQIVEAGTLDTGDYSIKGVETLASIERKSLSDLIGCVTSERERFTRELLRLRSYRCKAVIIEGTLQDILEHRYRSATAPEAVLGSVSAWSVRYEISFVFAGNAEGGSRYCISLLKNFHKQCSEFAKQFNQKEA